MPVGVQKTLLKDGYLTLRANIPKQVTGKEELVTLEDLGQKTRSVILVTFLLPFIAQVGLKGLMSKLWLWINMM